MIATEQASEAIRLALELGATDAECTLAEGEEFTAHVRMRALETLKDAGSRRAGLRVLVGQRVGSSHTSDLSSAGLRQMVESALAIAAISTEDPHAGLPDASELGALSGDLELYSDDIQSIATPARIQAALEAEEAALSWDPRITNSEGRILGPRFIAKLTGPRDRVEGPNDFSGSYVEGPYVAWRGAIALVGGRAKDQFVLKYPARRGGLHQRQASRIAVQTFLQIHRTVRAKGQDGPAGTGIDGAKRMIGAEQKTPVRVVAALPVIDAAIGDDVGCGRWRVCPYLAAVGGVQGNDGMVVR